VKKEESRKIKDKLKDKYRLIIYNDNTFKEEWFIRLSRLNVIAYGGGTIIVLLVLFYLSMAYTPMREMIPGYPDGTMRRNIIRNAFRVDSLERELAIRDQYFRNINLLISGEEPENYEPLNDTLPVQQEVIFERSAVDSLFRKQIEETEQFNVNQSLNMHESSGLAQMHFFAPVNGIITNSYNNGENHFGTDIVAGPNEVETGHVVQIQHENNLISVYKHNAEILKKVGNRVVAGEPIAIIGNSGELTTGPHLHFELWYKGKPLNPEDYIKF
ncbi:MAG: M23 family metallopeptidase, partial [Bacteroidota bacterium]